MEKSVFTPHYDRLRAKLRQMRAAAGLNQRELAAKLGRERSFVARIEMGERRIDLVEFFWIARACGQDPVETVMDLMTDFLKLQPKRRRARRR